MMPAARKKSCDYRQEQTAAGKHSQVQALQRSRSPARRASRFKLGLLIMSQADAGCRWIADLRADRLLPTLPLPGVLKHGVVCVMVPIGQLRVLLWAGGQQARRRLFENCPQL